MMKSGGVTFRCRPDRRCVPPRTQAPFLRRSCAGTISICATALVLALAAITAGCGTTEGDRNMSPPQAEAQASSVKEGGVWRESLHGDPTSIDPAFCGHGGYKVERLLFTGLATFDQNADLAMQPGLPTTPPSPVPRS
jgi:hypothetical protein